MLAWRLTPVSAPAWACARWFLVFGVLARCTGAGASMRLIARARRRECFAGRPDGGRPVGALRCAMRAFLVGDRGNLPGLRAAALAVEECAPPGSSISAAIGRGRKFSEK